MSFGAEPVESAAGLVRAIWRYDVGDTAVVVLWRAGKEITTTVTLGQRSGSGGV